MRKAVRVVFSLFLSYLVQATMLTYFRVGSIKLDVVTVVLFTAGFAGGMYTGFVTGLLGALLLEVLSGDLPGLSSVTSVAAGIFGAYMATWTGKYQTKGNKRRERFVKRTAPVASLVALIAAREIIFILYFYLTGADIAAMHFIRMVRCALLTGGIALLLMPPLSGFMTREKKKTFLYKWRKRRRSRKLPKRFGPRIDLDKESLIDLKTEISTQFLAELPPDLFDGIATITPKDSEDAPEGETETKQ